MLNTAKAAKNKEVLLTIVHSIYILFLSLIKHYQKSKLSLPSEGKGVF